MVVDRSGSMESIKADAEGGINTFIDQQKSEPGEALLTLVQFDNEYEFVHSGIPIQQIPKFKMVPRGSTALLDAIGRAINETGARLAVMDEAQRPGLIVFVVVTDGQENSSREFNRDQIRSMIEHQQTVYSWQFSFLAANQDAFAEGTSLGIAAAGIANFSGEKISGAHMAMARKVSRMRQSVNAGEAIDNNFTEEERQSML